jgi:DnaJ-class molecular chaperone
MPKSLSLVEIAMENTEMFQETCGLCRGSGLYGSSKCVVCDGAGVEKFLYPASAGPDAGCNHEAKIVDENGFAYCDDCGCPL